jgi:hypothetical protein
MSEHAPKAAPTQNQPIAAKEENVTYETDASTALLSLNLGSAAPPLNPRAVLQLQSTIGNAAVQRVLKTPQRSIRRKTATLPGVFTPSAPHIQRQEDEPEPASPPPARVGGGGPTAITPLDPGEPLRTREPRSDPALAEQRVEQVLGDIIPEALRTGRSIVGMVRVVDAATWERVGRTDFGDAWFDEDHAHTRASAAYTRFNEAGEPELVYVHADRGDTAHIMIHETIHVHSNNSNLHSDELVEGITEYYTRRVIRDLGLYATMPISYPQETRIIEMLIAYLGANGEQLIADAYFQNQTDQLVAAFLSVRGETATVSWAIFRTHLSRNRWTDAQAMLARS